MNLIFLPIFASLFIALTPKKLSYIVSGILSFIPLYVVYNFTGELNYEVFSGVNIGLAVTPLGEFFAYLIALSTPIALIASASKKDDKTFYFLFHILVFSLLIVVFANDLISFFIGWEMMTWSSYFLLARNKDACYKALQRYILFALASAFTLLGAIVISYSLTHSFALADNINYLSLENTYAANLAFGLFLISFLIKLGTMPLHYWVSSTYSRSGDFSAFFSAVLSKMGVYGLMILILSKSAFSLDANTIGTFLAWIGAFTSLVATFKAISQDEVKKLLAYSSIAQIGYIVTSFGVATSLGLTGAMYHTILHTAIKLLLFINVAGIIYMTGKKHFSTLGGLIYKMPFSFVSLLIGIIALAGMPPLGGFSSKFTIYSALIEANHPFLLAMVMFSSAAAFLYCFKLIYGIYLGHSNSDETKAVTKDAPAVFLIPQYIIAIFLMVVGTIPGIFTSYFNNILSSLGYAPITQNSIYEISSSFGTYNGAVVMGAFIGIFALILVVVLLLKSKAKQAQDEFDFSYCGEVPHSRSPLHYGYGIGHELNRVTFIGAILKRTTSKFYNSLGDELHNLSQFLRGMYSGNLSNIFAVTVVFFIVLLWLGM